jgi:hypothetical protein
MRTIERSRFGDRHLNRESMSPVFARSASASFRHTEYALYLCIFYSYVGPALGISVPYLATILIMGLTAFCIVRRRSSLWMIHRSVFRPLLCIISWLAIQYFIHSSSLSDLIPFFVWAAIIVLIQSAFVRPGFLHRFSFVMFLVGISLVPFLDLRPGEGAERAGLSIASVLANPNALAVWFGFCAIYFLIRSLQTSGLHDRLISGGLALVSMLIVGLTVSRSVLVGVAVSLVLCFRDQLKRGFVPVLIAVVLLCGAFAYGLFDNTIGHYVSRGTEEEGRTGVIPYAFQRFLDFPLAGVGVSNIGTVVPGRESGTAPHNALLFFALSSGVVPIFLFLAYWSSAFRGALRSTSSHPYAGYLMPLLIYCTVALLFNDTVYMFPWFVAVFSACLSRPQIASPGWAPARHFQNASYSR